MSNEGTARFTCFPQRVEDLDRATAEAADHYYEIVMRISLDVIDYVRFTSNMSVRRWYIDAYGGLCSSGDPFKCILVYPEGYETEGILIVPDENCVVAYAAHV